MEGCRVDENDTEHCDGHREGDECKCLHEEQGAAAQVEAAVTGEEQVAEVVVPAEAVTGSESTEVQQPEESAKDTAPANAAEEQVDSKA